jgi:hypothetical protein
MSGSATANGKTQTARARKAAAHRNGKSAKEKAAAGRGRTTRERVEHDLETRPHGRTAKVLTHPRLGALRQSLETWVQRVTMPATDWTHRAISAAERRTARRLRTAAAQLGRIAYGLDAAGQRLESQRSSRNGASVRHAAADGPFDDEFCAPHLA